MDMRPGDPGGGVGEVPQQTRVRGGGGAPPNIIFFARNLRIFSSAYVSDDYIFKKSHNFFFYCSKTFSHFLSAFSEINFGQ